MSGFWAAYGAPAAVDWCEPNYAVVGGVAEMWNTVSSLAIFATGAYGLARWWGHRDTLELRFGVSFACLAVIGLGSAAFHATLLRIPQAFDELPMVWLSLACFYCLVVRSEQTPSAVRHRWVGALVAYALGFGAAYFLVEGYFALFLGSYGAVVAYVCVVTWRLAFREKRDDRLRGMFWWSVVAYIGGFLVFWIPERTLGCDHPLQALQLHALFHLSGAVGPYAWVLFATTDRMARLGRPVTVARRPIPFVVPSGGASTLPG